MPQSTKQNQPEQRGGLPPDGVRRVAARPMGAYGASARYASIRRVGK